MDNKNLWKNDKGQAMVLVALFFSVLLGFGALAVDYAYLSLQKRELQNAADAAALAGIVDFSEGKVSEAEDDKIIEYARKNSKALRNIAALPIIIDRNNEKKQLKVTISLDYDMLFAKVIGIKSKTVSASATAAWTAKTINNNGNNSLNNKIIPIAILDSENQKFKNENLAFIGYYHKIGTRDQEKFYGNYGFFTHNNKVSKLKEFKEKDLKESFAGNNKKPLLENFYSGDNYLASLEERYDDEAKKGIKERIKYAEKPGANRKEIMTAIIPIVRIREEGVGYRKKQIRRDDDGELKDDGEHFEFDIVGYRKVIIEDFVKEVKILGGGTFFGRIYGENNNVWSFWDFDDADIKRLNWALDKEEKYEKSIVVTFKEYLSLEDLNNGGNESKIVYRLVK